MRSIDIALHHTGLLFGTLSRKVFFLAVRDAAGFGSPMQACGTSGWSLNYGVQLDCTEESVDVINHAMMCEPILNLDSGASYFVSGTRSTCQ